MAELNITPVIPGAVAPEPAPAAVAGTRPDNVPEKFWNVDSGTVNVDALMASYTSLETKQSAPADPAAPAAPAAADPAAAPAATPLRIDAEAAATEAGLDFAGMEAEFLADGKLGDATYAKAEAAGIPKAVVDSYIAGQQAQADALAGRLHSVTGGAEKFGAMLAWAKTALTPADAGAFNASIDSGDEATMALAVTGLNAKFVAANGVIPTLLGGDVPGGAGGGYASSAEVVAAMSDPRYKSDPAYNAMVADKLDRSDVFS